MLARRFNGGAAGKRNSEQGRGSGPIMLARRFNGGCRRKTKPRAKPRERLHNASPPFQRRVPPDNGTPSKAAGAAQ
jgi:hypothetical protein